MIGVDSLHSFFRAGPPEIWHHPKVVEASKKLQHRVAMYKTDSGWVKRKCGCMDVWQPDPRWGKKRFFLPLGMCRIVDPGQHLLQPKTSCSSHRVLGK